MLNQQSHVHDHLSNADSSHPCAPSDGKPRGPRDSKKDQAILALLQYSTYQEAARAVGVDTTTLWRWQRQPAFQEALRKARREHFSHTIAQLQQSSRTAAAVLQQLMLDENAPAASRVRAAHAVLDQARKSIELDDLAARVAKLERAGRDANTVQKN